MSCRCRAMPPLPAPCSQLASVTSPRHAGSTAITCSRARLQRCGAKRRPVGSPGFGSLVELHVDRRLHTRRAVHLAGGGRLRCCSSVRLAVSPVVPLHKVPPRAVLWSVHRTPERCVSCWRHNIIPARGCYPFQRSSALVPALAPGRLSFAASIAQAWPFRLARPAVQACEQQRWFLRPPRQALAGARTTSAASRVSR